MITKFLLQIGWKVASPQDRCLLILAGILGFALPARAALTNVLMPLLSLVGLYLHTELVATDAVQRAAR